MTITTKDIRTMYEKGYTHTEIAEKYLQSGDVESFTEALKVVETVILEYKRR